MRGIVYRYKAESSSPTQSLHSICPKCGQIIKVDADCECEQRLLTLVV